MVKLDWVAGAFYMDHKIENHIKGYRDNGTRMVKLSMYAMRPVR